ncbi:sensor histidine kinase [Flavobacterium aestivum]|uniref:sensor histidine kinase n=1 Tax=Flavobacterium aestivum TaxID=3003257 RepID=UPI002482FBA1|nr:HAMP domain-containing sensor histidine kinase [Flavobacterium aestivum]
MTKAFDAISSSNKVSQLVNKVRNPLVNSQENFNNYINYKDASSLSKYSASLSEMNLLLDTLNLMTKDNIEFKNILNKKTKAEDEIQALKTTINSIIEKRVSPNLVDVSDLFKFKKFEFKTILDDIKISSDKKIDSVQKKGLFSRLGNALIGKQDVQKEWSNIIVTMKYKDKVTSGSIEKQISDAFMTTNKYYENEFRNLKKTFISLKNKDLGLIKLNNELLNLSQKILSDYENSAKALQASSQKNLQDQYESNKTVRNYSIIIVTVLMLIISIILFSFTRLAFEYEKRLSDAQNQIRQSLNFKNRIMGMISHEVRSPLSIISIFSKKVSSSIQDTGIKDAFKSIEFTTSSLLLLTNQILEYSKNEDSRLELKSKNINLKTEINQIISAVTSLVESKGNRVKVNSNLDSDYEVYSDATKIHQLFYNIIGNANKFTENGLISIAIDLETISDYEMNLKVEVIDTGSGIPENDLKYIFESYYQGAVSNNVKDLGVGLGLNLCKEIIELFDGEINVESEENKGTKVAFNLMLSQA